MKKRKKVSGLQRESASLAGRGSSKKRQDVLNKVDSFLSKESLAW